MQINKLEPTITKQQVEERTNSINQLEQEYMQIQAQRKKVFFSPIIDSHNNKQIITSFKKNNSIENQNFYNNLNIATNLKLTEIFINLVKQLELINKFYCGSNNSNKIANLIVRIESETVNADIIPRFKNICYWLHGLINLLQNFQYQHGNLPKTTTISKETIAVIITECLEYSHACWDGIGSRFAHKYEILNSMNQGLSGKIFLIKKELFQTLASQFIYRLQQDMNYKFSEVMEIHVYNLLHNFTAQKLGFNKINDYFLPNDLPIAFLEEFKELATIDVSPTNITRILAEQLYENLANCLAKIHLQDWLYQPKKDTEITNNLHLLNTEVFSPTNILFSTSGKNLSISTIIDEIKINDEFFFSLNNSKEKLHFWIADNLMPNTEKILVSNIYSENIQSYFSIASIDDMFFWVYKQDRYESRLPKYKFDADKYVTLDLSYIQQFDFISLNFANIGSCVHITDHCQKIAISINLASQALYQTKSAITIMLFFIDNMIYMQENSPLITQKLYNIIKNKLTDNVFKQYFINEINNYYANPLITKITKNEISFFIQCEIFKDIFSKIINQQINIEECSQLNTKETETIVEQIKIFSPSTLKILLSSKKNKLIILSLAIKNDDSELVYSIIKDNDEYLDLINNNNYNIILSLAIKNCDADFIDLLLKINNVKISSYTFYNAINSSNYDLLSKIIKHINDNINLFNKQELLNLLHLKNTTGTPAVIIALISETPYIIVEYFKFVISLKQLNSQEKLSLIKLNYYNNETWLSHIENSSLVRRYNTICVPSYIKAISKIPGFSHKQLLEIIEAKNDEGDPWLYLAMKFKYNSTAKAYLKHIMANDCLNTAEKFNIILAQGNQGTGLSIAIQSNNSDIITFYCAHILSQKDFFNASQIFELLQANNMKGNSGLSFIITKCDLIYNTELLFSYIYLILENNILNNQQKIELLLAKSSDGITILQIVLQKNRYIAHLYIEKILESYELTAEQKLELVFAKDKNDNNTIDLAIDKNIHFILSKIIKYISITKLSIEPTKYKIHNDCIYVLNNYIYAILTTEKLTLKQKTDVFDVTIYYGFYKNYEEIIEKSNLSAENKKELLINKVVPATTNF